MYTALAIHIGRESAAFLDGTPLFAELTKLSPEASPVLPGFSSTNADRKVRVKAPPSKSYANQEEVLDGVLDGLVRERLVEISYCSRSGGTKARVVAPLTLVLFRQGLYLLAIRKEGLDSDTIGPIQRFAVDRIREVRVAEPFCYPSCWDPDAELSVPFGMHSGGELGEVVVWFDQRVADLVRERRFHPSQVVLDVEDGIELRMETCGLELVSFVLEWGAMAEARAPDWLRMRVAKELHQALGHYL